MNLFLMKNPSAFIFPVNAISHAGQSVGLSMSFDLCLSVSQSVCHNYALILFLLMSMLSIVSCQLTRFHLVSYYPVGFEKLLLLR